MKWINCWILNNFAEFSRIVSAGEKNKFEKIIPKREPIIYVPNGLDLANNTNSYKNDL